FDSLFIPAVQFPGQAKVGVPAQGDLPGMRATNLIARSIQGTQPSWLTTLPGRLTRVEHFVGVGERDHQRRIAPDSFVGKSHPAFTLPEGRRNRAAGAKKAFCK